MVNKIGCAILLFALIVSLCCLAISGSTTGPNRLQGVGFESQLGELKCGYESCPPTDPNKINIHIVAHTHDDVGWLKTVDQYYYGTRKALNSVGVQYILDSVVPQLLMDKSKRFIFVEMSFFSKWWQEQDDHMKTIVRRLVNEGRLEFINGGWCMNDEATVNYRSTIEQMTLGLRFLNESFGACAHPKVGWQIDPFGHSNEQASLFAQFGFDGMYFTRINYEDKAKRTSNSSLDIIWHGDRAQVGQSGSIFTNIFRDGYDAPDGFCFDVQCKDDSLVDNRRSYEYNIETRGNEYLEYLRKYAKAKLTNNILVPMGGDFQFSAAGQNFKNLDKLMKFVRENGPEFNIFYSTPSCYQFALYQSTVAQSVATQSGDSDSRVKLPEKYDDFMPYDSSHGIWWSGYFSSRPSVKLVERETANLLQVTRLISLANLLKSQGIGKRWVDEVAEHEARCLMPLWEVLADLQHHDAVTGTEKQLVTDDYVRRASEAASLCAKFIGDLRRAKLNEYLKKSTARYEQLRELGKRFKLDPVYLEDTMLCPLLNISQCNAMESEVDVRKYAHLSHVNLTVLHSRKADETPSSGRNRRSSSAWPRLSEMVPELETKGVLLNVYNPLTQPVSQYDVRLPCNGRCDLDKIRVIHLATNETIKLIRLPVPSGVIQLPFRDSMTSYDVLFYANIPALGYTSFVIEDLNNEDIVDEEHEDSSIVISDETNRSNAVRSRRVRSDEVKGEKYDYFIMGSDDEDAQISSSRSRRDSSLSQQAAADRVIVKFDMNTGMIVSLKRAIDGSVLNVTQRFGTYLPSSQAGAYIFKPQTSEPHMMDKPMMYKMFKRRNGALIEIHQKWADWLWQTIRVDAKKNYIEFDYVVGPIPVDGKSGREVITRYMTSLPNNGVFMTDSNGRQLLARHRLKSQASEQVGGSFYPVVTTIMMRNNGHQKRQHQNNSNHNSRNSVEAVAVLVDRAQAGTSLNEGQLELLIHRRLLNDDNFGVGEALNEPGEDGRGLVSRGKHRLYLKFHDLHESSNSSSSPSSSGAPGGSATTTAHDKSRRGKVRLLKLPETPRSNLEYELNNYATKKGVDPASVIATDTYIVQDRVLNDLNHEARRLALKPTLTFDRLRVSVGEFIDMIANSGNNKIKTDLTLLNATLPSNVHLLTLQPWNNGNNRILLRFENLDNPITLHPFPDYEVYHSLLRSYRLMSELVELDSSDGCSEKLKPQVEFDIEYLIRRIRIVSIEEMNLGANVELKDDKRLNWTDENYDSEACGRAATATSIKLAPRQIRTFIAKFEFI